MFNEKTYEIKDRYGDFHTMTAQRLYKLIMKNSQFNYNWFASARELVRVCQEVGFPEEYSQGIRVAILNCFSNRMSIVTSRDDGASYLWNKEDLEAAQYCYNSLSGVVTGEVVSVRRRFLTEMLKNTTQARMMSPFYHPGVTYQRIKRSFIKSRFELFLSWENLDLKFLEESVRNDFFEIIRKADENGIFFEDEKADQRMWDAFYRQKIS